MVRYHLANRQYQQPDMWINSRFAVVTEEEILQMRTFLECVVLSPKLYMLIQLSSSISVNCDFQNIQLHSSHVNEYSAAIHNDC